MPNKDNMSLNDVMGKPATNTSHIDLTKGGINVTETNNEQTKTPQQPIARKARPVVSGPIDFNTMKDADINKILPKREPKPSEEENQLMSMLDAAVEREKKNISDRQDAILEAQDKEMEAVELAREEEEYDKELFGEAENSNNNVVNTADVVNTIDTVDDYYDENDDYDEDYHAPRNVNKFSVDVDSVEIDEPEDELVETVMTNPPVKEIRRHSLDESQIEELREETSNLNDTAVNSVLVETVSPEATKKSTITTEEEFDFIKELGLDDEEAEPEVVEAPPAKPEENEANNEKILEDIKTQVKERVENVRKNLDLSKFTISKKAVSVQKVMKMAVRAHQSIADWVLYNAERPITVSGLSGPEILKLNPTVTNSNRLNAFKDSYRVIYDHLIDGNKPEFETWLKQTNFVDLQHIYFALYMATFGNSNFVSLECPNEKCKKVFIKDIKIEDMIEYANDETRTKVRDILRKDTTTQKKDEYNVDIVQISNTYAFAIKTPSIWNVIIETSSLPDKVIEKYSDLIDVVSYIDTIYVINESTSELIPVDYKIEPNDISKSAARRIKACYDVISSLSSEDYYYLRNIISDYDKNINDISYIIPEAVCPECGTKIPANKDLSADGLVFMRHQLAAIGNM